MRSPPCSGGSLHTLVTPTGHLNFARILDHSSAFAGESPSSEKYGRPDLRPCLLAYLEIFSNSPGGGMYHMRSLVRYLRVAAFFRPHAALAR